MIVDQKFDLGNGGYTVSYLCSECFRVFDINFLFKSDDILKGYRVTTKVDEIHFCPFCGKEA